MSLSDLKGGIIFKTFTKKTIKKLDVYLDLVNIKIFRKKIYETINLNDSKI